ncbi:MAG TPA: choice-of-anchor J domain-containing protein [Pyrinomonadaceae bacterium]
MPSESGFFKRLPVLAAVLFFLLAGGIGLARAQVIENFDNITLLPSRGWFTQNNSIPVGSTGWFQGNPNVFPAPSGAANSYIAANFNNTTGTNTISNWLVAPNLTLRNGDSITFWTRTTPQSAFPDRLEVRLSTNGASTNVGTGPNAVGDFTALLLTINPNLELGGYPEIWTQYTIVLTGLPAGGVSGRAAFCYFVTGAGPSGDNATYIGIDTFSINTGDPPPPLDAPLDYNGDGKTDYTLVRHAVGSPGEKLNWFIHDGTTATQTQWGQVEDQPVAGDFDGDGKDDISVYRAAQNSVFYTLRSSNGTFAARPLGTLGDDPNIIGDYSGDGIDDYAVYRRGASAGQPSFWYYRHNVLGAEEIFTAVQYGQSGDIPAPGDYDGDNRHDFCVRRNNGNGQGVFYLRKSNGTADEAVLWGTTGDVIVSGDYDGDDRTDFGVVRRGEGDKILWSVLGRNNNNVIHFGQIWGLANFDFMVPGDYDGDGKTDLAVWRPNPDPAQNFFFVRKSSDGSLSAFEWGQSGDYPLARVNKH